MCEHLHLSCLLTLFQRESQRFNFSRIDLLSLTCQCLSVCLVSFTLEFHLTLVLHTGQDWKLEKKSSDIYVPNNGGGLSSDMNVDEETPLTQSSRLSHVGRSSIGSHGA